MNDKDLINRNTDQNAVFANPGSTEVLPKVESKVESKAESKPIVDPIPTPVAKPVVIVDPPVQVQEPTPVVPKINETLPNKPADPVAQVSEVEHYKKQNELLREQLNAVNTPPAVVSTEINKTDEPQSKTEPLPKVAPTESLVTDDQLKKLQEGDFSEFKDILANVANAGAQMGVEQALEGLNTTIQETASAVVNDKLAVEKALNNFFKDNSNLDKYQGMVTDKAKVIEAGWIRENKKYSINELLQAAGEIVLPMVAAYQPDGVPTPSTPIISGGGNVIVAPVVTNPKDLTQKDHMDKVFAPEANA